MLLPLLYYSYGYAPGYSYGYAPAYAYAPAYSYGYAPTYSYGYAPAYGYAYAPRYSYRPLCALGFTRMLRIGDIGDGTTVDENPSSLRGAARPLRLANTFPVVPHPSRHADIS